MAKKLKTKVFAPEGFHFMIKKNGNFYLQIKDYAPHTLTNGDKSSPYVMMEYTTTHPAPKVGEPGSAANRTVGPTVRTTTGTVTNTSGRSTTRSTSGGSSGGSGGGGSYGGGY